MSNTSHKEFLSEGLAAGVVTRLVTMPPSEAHDEIRRGLPLHVVLETFSTGLNFSLADTAAVLDVAPRTMQRWKSDKKKTLDAAPASRFYRLMRIVKDAIAEFGSSNAAIDWLHEEQPGLGYRRPIDLMSTDPGASSVEALLARIRYGVYT